MEVIKLGFGKEYPVLADISEKLDSLDLRIQVDQLNWKEFAYKPDVRFSIAYTTNEILLKYYVTEEWSKAEMTESNQAVYEDSCVEFFVSPAGDGIFYNFEFNCIGTCLMGTGTSRENRTRVDPGIISRIRRLPSLGEKPFAERKGLSSWDITLAFPLEVFYLHKITELKGREFRVNFYKCGDKLTVPHFLTWSPVKTEKPDYHRPEYFGLLKFI